MGDFKVGAQNKAIWDSANNLKVSKPSTQAASESPQASTAAEARTSSATQSDIVLSTKQGKAGVYDMSLDVPMGAAGKMEPNSGQFGGNNAFTQKLNQSFGALNQAEGHLYQREAELKSQIAHAEQTLQEVRLPDSHGLLEQHRQSKDIAAQSDSAWTSAMQRRNGAAMEVQILKSIPHSVSEMRDEVSKERSNLNKLRSKLGAGEIKQTEAKIQAKSAEIEHLQKRYKNELQGAIQTLSSAEKENEQAGVHHHKNLAEVKRLGAEIEASELQARPQSDPAVKEAAKALKTLQDAYQAECGDEGSLKKMVNSARNAYSQSLSENK